MPVLERKAGWKEKALLVAGLPPKGDVDPDELMAELRSLAEAAGAIVKGEVVQNLRRPNPATYLGKGKVQEIAQRVRDEKLDVVIAGVALSPAQIRNLETMAQTKVIDRTELILDIFARRAKSRQARLQVELAQLQYSLPRLRRMWSHLSRIEGGIGLRGPGEKQLEVDRRLAQRRIADLRRSLEEIRLRKEREVSTRVTDRTACLVGYTNAGKSSLLNALTGSDVHQSDQMFSTLDTRTRLWDVEKDLPVLLSDTVGFIQDLPHELVESFHATLEEATQADLLLHVADVSLRDPYPRILSVQAVMRELSIDKSPRILVFNKVDALKDRMELQILTSQFPESLAVSAHTGEGMDELRARVRDFFLQEMVEFDIRTHCGNGRLLAFLRKMGRVSNVSYEGDFVRCQGRILERHLGQAVRMNDTDQPREENGGDDV